MIHQVDAQQLAGVGSHADDELYALDTIENQIAAVVAANGQTPRGFLVVRALARLGAKSAYHTRQT